MFAVTVGGNPVPVAGSLADTPTMRTNAASSYTFSGVDFGDPDAARWIVVVLAFQATTTRTFTSVTIGGHAASQVFFARDGLTISQAGVACYKVLLPTGSSGTVVVSLSGQVNKLAMAPFRIVGTGDAVVATAASDAAVDPVSVDCAGGEFIVAIAVGFNPGTIPFSGVIRDWTASDEGVVNSAGHFSITAAGPHAVSAPMSGRIFCAALGIAAFH